MLTPEQIKKLNINDKLLVQGEFIKAHDNGSILVSLCSKAWESSIHELLFFHPSSVSLPSEIVNSQSSIVNKYDPTRLFKKGDRVRIKREINGRKLNHVFVNFSYNKTYTVAQDEEQKEYQSGLVKIINETGHTFTGSFYELELVTPVEELEPYSVEEETAFADDEQYGIIHIYYNYNGGRDKVRTFYENGPESWNATKAAAEAERDRLNEEWRKEQK